jgi:hypothetical protein
MSTEELYARCDGCGATFADRLLACYVGTCNASARTSLHACLKRTNRHPYVRHAGAGARSP